MRADDRIALESWRVLRRALAGASYHGQKQILGRASLTAIMDYHGSDKGALHGYGFGLRVGHGYSRVYEGLFASRRDRPITLLEIGVGPKQPGVTGAARRQQLCGSVTGWHEYFPAAEIHAADIVDCRALTRDRLTIHVADQSSRTSMEALAQAIGSALDVVIDDGSHASAHQQISLASLVSHLSDDAIYVVEDLQWQPDDLENGATPKTIELLRSLRDTGDFPSSVLTSDERRAIENRLRVVTIEEGLGKVNAAFAVLTKPRV